MYDIIIKELLPFLTILTIFQKLTTTWIWSNGTFLVAVSPFAFYVFVTFVSFGRTPRFAIVSNSCTSIVLLFSILCFIYEWEYARFIFLWPAYCYTSYRMKYRVVMKVENIALYLAWCNWVVILYFISFSIQKPFA